MGKRERTRHEIIQEMLHVTLQEQMISKTRMMQQAYINPNSFQRYFRYMLGNGYIVRCKQKTEKYMVTDAGRSLFEKLQEMNPLICKDDI